MDLKPCPFCGSIDIRLSKSEFNRSYFCENCGVSTAACASEFVSRKEWNTRLVEDALRAKLAEQVALQQDLAKQMTENFAATAKLGKELAECKAVMRELNDDLFHFYDMDGVQMIKALRKYDRENMEKFEHIARE